MLTILEYPPRYQPSIRTIPRKIGWAEQYTYAAEQNMQNLSTDKENYGVYLANLGGWRFYKAIGYSTPRYYEDRLDGVTYQKIFAGVPVK